jgi:hypothetical protein
VRKTIFVFSFERGIAKAKFVSFKVPDGRKEMTKWARYMMDYTRKSVVFLFVDVAQDCATQ